jgi:hypothetical protein
VWRRAAGGVGGGGCARAQVRAWRERTHTHCHSGQPQCNHARQHRNSTPTTHTRTHTRARTHLRVLHKRRLDAGLLAKLVEDHRDAQAVAALQDVLHQCGLCIALRHTHTAAAAAGHTRAHARSHGVNPAGSSAACGRMAAGSAAAAHLAGAQVACSSGAAQRACGTCARTTHSGHERRGRSARQPSGA